MVSLVVPTINRVAEVERLLASLDAQTFRDFEVIVIDQNPDDRLVPVLQQHSDLKIRHLRSERGAGRARNHGLRAAAGEIIAFPDDDCWYPSSILASIVQWFDRHPEFEGVFTTMHDADHHPVGPRWLAAPTRITKSNLWNTTIAATAYLRDKAATEVGFFREDIGVGASTAFQSGEETDYFLRALSLDFAMWYEPSLVVHHPNLHSLGRLRATTYSFALGSGYVLRIHGYSWFEFAGFLLRSLGGAVISLLKLDLPNARIYLLRAAGQLRGYIMGPRDLARAKSGSQKLA